MKKIKLIINTKSKNYPILPINSVYSNNIQKWSIPNNGLCMPPGICGNVYGRKKVEYSKEPVNPPLYDVKNPRVNFYTSEPDRK